MLIQELEEQLAEQKKLLKSVASRGEEILTQQASPVRARYHFSHILLEYHFYLKLLHLWLSLHSSVCQMFCSATEILSPDVEQEGDTQAVKKQRRKRWESLKKDMATKLQLLMNTLEQDSKQPVRWLHYSVHEASWSFETFENHLLWTSDSECVKLPKVMWFQ